MKNAPADTWIYPTCNGLYCAPGDFYIDPGKPVDRAVVTHGHADHARPGHGRVLATAETIDIMHVRYGQDCAAAFQKISHTETLTQNGVQLRLPPAGHILGSAQVVLEYQGTRVVVSGDYKTDPDPTCHPFELVPCDVFVTEATFGLPVFRHESIYDECHKLVASLQSQPDRTHLLGVYGLGKCQRMLKEIRHVGYDAPIYLHGALAKVTDYYLTQGQNFGDVRPVNETNKNDMQGALVLCPPSSISGRWAQKFGDAVSVFASGWMRVRGRARQRGVELPLIVSDHADWPGLIETIVATGAEDVWVTHGREDALVHQLSQMGRRARALALVGFDDEGGE